MKDIVRTKRLHFTEIRRVRLVRILILPDYSIALLVEFDSIIIVLHISKILFYDLLNYFRSYFLSLVQSKVHASQRHVTHTLSYQEMALVFDQVPVRVSPTETIFLSSGNTSVTFPPVSSVLPLAELAGARPEDCEQEEVALEPLACAGLW